MKRKKKKIDEHKGIGENIKVEQMNELNERWFHQSDQPTNTILQYLMDLLFVMWLKLFGRQTRLFFDFQRAEPTISTKLLVVFFCISIFLNLTILFQPTDRLSVPITEIM